MNEAMTVVKEFAEFASPAVAFFWEIAQAQVSVLIFQNIFALSIFAGLITLLVILIKDIVAKSPYFGAERDEYEEEIKKASRLKRFFAKQEFDPEFVTFVRGISGVIIAMLFLYSVCIVQSTIGMFMNPDYYALQQATELYKQAR
jgi:hypothetical protein